MKTAFVTGGAGFLGLNLVEELVTGGWDVCVLDRTGPRARNVELGGVRWIRGDVTDPAVVERAMPERVDAVFHAAADTSHWSARAADQTRVNVGGTRVVVEAALKRKARRFIQTSSIAAYGFHDEIIDEQTPSTAMACPINYSRTKHLAELEVRKGVDRGLDAVLMNPANILGPYDDYGWSRLLVMLDRKGRLPGAPPARASFCHARRVAAAHVSAFDRGRRGQNYLLGGADATFFDLAREMQSLVGGKLPGRPTPAWLLRALGRVSLWASYLTRKEPDLTPEKAVLVTCDLVCTSARAERELGYAPLPLKAMLEDCHAWMVGEGLLSGKERENPR